ncbi:hypothetical protein HYH03_004609 [Edaphochlamys debaryana]|uniref:Uncharacterized protein n=1 Tax=Edaphochlamys debaryana TaxID=47281 RepID=A0A836C398_9CHLO|nr:hypothetical protein HYH03_004609 [Edaphochlamys debaryana]|eukprot:KAG2497454.1 hypothetical protein HYH03_004609 [Edaphochlamys debaryana]
MGSEASRLAREDIRRGPHEVAAKLQARAADPNKCLLFSEDCGPLPRGSKVTPLGYAILSGDIALLDVLLIHGADPNKRVGLPHRFNFTPLQLAAALGQAETVRRLLTTGCVDANAKLQMKTGTTSPPNEPQPTSQPTAALRPQQGVLVPSDFTYTRAGDTALHMAVDCHPEDGGCEVIHTLIDYRGTDLNARSQKQRTPLYKACRGRHHMMASLLASHLRCDVNAGGPIFAAIAAESPSLVQLLVNAGADVRASVVNERGRTPLRYAMTRSSLFFTSRADVIQKLIRAGAEVEPGMLDHARQNNWQRVARVLQETRAEPGRPMPSAPPVRAVRASAVSGPPPPPPPQSTLSRARPAAAAELQRALDEATAASPRARSSASAPSLRPSEAPVSPSRGGQGGAPAADGEEDAVGGRPPRVHPAAAFLAGGVAKKLMGRGFWPVAILAAAVLYGRHLASEVAQGGFERTRERLPERARQRTAAAAAPATQAAGASSAGAAAGAGSSCGGGGGGEAHEQEGMCCICMCSKATRGFLHGDVVHVCVCEDCEEELQRRGQLKGCPICRKPFRAVLKAVTT